MTMGIIKRIYIDYKSLDLGNILFLIGVFFLPSALPIAGLFLLISIILSFKSNNYISLKDKWNLPLFTSIGIILFSTLNISFIDKPLILSTYNLSTIWINLINWLPLFLYFWGFQNYLITNKQKVFFAQSLVSGTFPVILSIILQKYFNLYGPYKTFYGLIIWFQKTIYDGQPASGLFSNPNYTAIWLGLVLPFAIILLILTKNFSFKKYILLILCFLITFMILLTASRNGILAIVITIFCIYGLRNFLIFFSSLISIFSVSKLISFLVNKDITFYDSILPQTLISKLSEFGYFKTFPRLEIWQSALTRIQERPFWGWGPSTFSFLNKNNNSTFTIPFLPVKAEHSHNLTLELAHNFGIPLSLILTTTIFLFLIISWKLIFFEIPLNHDLLLKKAFFTSCLIAFVSHLNDVTLYDGKISIIVCILLAGLKTIVNKKKEYQNL
tara:strand:+ start:131 stop:1456 length:1326 start_codon:yes stop_codon:yes gene_type:complete